MNGKPSQPGSRSACYSRRACGRCLRRHPSTLAQTIATLDRLTNGRAILGLGAGEAMNLVPYGIEADKPFTRLKEACELIKKLWSATPEEPATYQGKFYRLNNAFLQVKPKQNPHPPIYIGALGQKTRELCGEVADGWLSWMNTPETYRERLKDVEKGASRAGRSLSEIDKTAWVHVAIDKDREIARKAATWTTMMDLIYENEILKRYGGDNVPPELYSIKQTTITKEIMDKSKKLCRDAPADVVDLTSAYGTAEDCIEKLEEYRQAGAEHIIVVNVSPDFEGSLKVFQENIIPYFKETET